MNVYGVAGCKPVLAPDTLLPAHTLDWETIEVRFDLFGSLNKVYIEIQKILLLLDVIEPPL